MVFKATRLGEITKGECVDREENKGLGPQGAGEWEARGIMGWVAVGYLACRSSDPECMKTQDTLVLSTLAGHKSTTKYIFGYLEILFFFLSSF